MRCHREIAEQAFACGNHRMAGRDHLAKSPHRDVAESLRCRKQLPVLQLIAQHGIGDVVGRQREACNLDQQRLVRQRGGIGQLCLDHLACLQIIAGDDEVGGFHGGDPGLLRVLIFAAVDNPFATATKFETLFASGA
jgi:hypothetical protein